MKTKVSSMLDALADGLEAKGLVKEAYEIDKIADLIEGQAEVPPAMVAQAIKEAIVIVRQRQGAGGVVTAAEITGSNLGKSIAMALLMGIGALAKAGEPVDTTGISDVLSRASDNLATIQITGMLPTPKMGNVSGLRIRIATKAQEAAYGTINALDKGLAEKGVRTTERQQILKPILSNMGMLL